MHPERMQDEVLDRSQNPELARGAAAHPKRPGEACRAPAATWTPEVDRFMCEGKRDCLAVCPYDVFVVRTIAAEGFRALSWLGRLKSMAHGRQSACTPQACRACGLCVTACPERAIMLVPCRAKAG